MNELKNYAEMSFSNPILLDVFGRYMENSVLVSFVSQNGTLNLKFRVNPPVEPPKNCEQVLSLLFALLESDTDGSVGRAYASKRLEILRDTIFSLSHILDGFSSVRLTIHTTERSPENPDAEVTKHTEFTLNRTKSGNKIVN